MIDVDAAQENDPALVRLAAAVRRTSELTRARARLGVRHEDADEVLGTIATDDAVDFDPRPVLRALHGCGVPVVVIGQVAGILHGSAELTGDLDLLWSGDPVHAPALAAAFAAVGASLVDDDGHAVPCDAPAFTLPKVLFSTPFASGDCCTPRLPWGDLSVEDFLARAITSISVEGYAVAYLRRDDLTRMRRAVGRPKDNRRADELERMTEG